MLSFESLWVCKHCTEAFCGVEFRLSKDFVLLEFLKKKTFSAVGFGQDKIPFLSTQQRAFERENKALTKKNYIMYLNFFSLLSQIQEHEEYSQI